MEGLKSDKPDSADDKTKPKDEKDAIEMSDDFGAALENKSIGMDIVCCVLYIIVASMDPGAMMLAQ